MPVGAHRSLAVPVGPVAQKPEAHSALAVQEAPTDEPGEHTPRLIAYPLAQAVAVQPLGDLRGVKSVGEQKLHTQKAVGSGSGKAVEKSMLVVEHGQIGGKAGHKAPEGKEAWAEHQAYPSAWRTRRPG